MEYLTAGKVVHKWADTAPLRANPWKQIGESTQGNVRTIGKDNVQKQHERRLQESLSQLRANGADGVTIEELGYYIKRTGIVSGSKLDAGNTDSSRSGR